MNTHAATRDILGRALIQVLVLLLLALLFSSPARAQSPSPDDTLTAFRLTDQWVRAWQVPTASDSKSPRAVGACITLRLRNEVIARAAAWSDTIAGPDAPSPDVLRRAAAAALAQAEPRLGVPNDAMRDAAIKEVARDIAISVELAGPLSTLHLDTWDQAELTLRPGLDGVAVRIGSPEKAPSTTWASGPPGNDPAPLTSIFPSQMMPANILPHRALGGLISKSLGEGGSAAALDEPKKLREQTGVRMYRFRVTHATQAQPDAPASLLYRGLRLLPSSQVVTTASLREMADQMTEFLLRSTNGEVSIEAQAFACMALESHASLLHEPENGPHVSAARQATRSFQRRLSTLKMYDVPLPTLETLSAAGFSTLAQVCDPLYFKIKKQQGDGVKCSAAEKGLQTLAVVAPSSAMGLSGCAIGDLQTEDRIQTSIRAAFAEIPEAQLVSAMPWLGIAAVRNGQPGPVTHSLTLPETRPARKDVIGALALRRMRDQCWQHQLSATDITEDTLDMAGGIVFTSGLGEGRGLPYPTWQCVRPLAFIATMLGDPRLTEPAERTNQIVHLMQAMRFLRQLQVDEASAWMYPDPKAALGGIRASTWDNSLPPDATSLTLLCVVELLKSLDALAKPAAEAAPASK